MLTPPSAFRENARRALENDSLQRALSKASDRFTDARAAAFAAFPEGEALRDRARAIKAETLSRLEDHLARLSDSVRRAGGVVHRAATAEEACRIIIGIARDAGARTVVKSKSMTTEEIDLNRALELAGVTPVETDLGEFIIQIAGESPSHIIAPAIHKSKDEVADLFVQKLGTPRLTLHEELTKEARKILRDQFRRADLGISGVNFAIAETGTIVIVENEGNARLSTSLPRTHVAVMGMEKVIPDWPSLSVFLKILARSATGQKMSSYVSLITGPRREGEEDGPDAFHLVILDNGRSRLLADDRLRESLYCIRCGACLNACPVYRRAGGHAYGSVYSGPIGAVITPSFVGEDKAGPLPFASSLCGACRDVCPVRIDIPHLLLVQRERVVRRRVAPFERTLVKVFTWAMREERRYRWASALAYWMSRPFARSGFLTRAPGLSPWTRTRDFPAPARPTFRERWRSRG